MRTPPTKAGGLRRGRGPGQYSTTPSPSNIAALWCTRGLPCPDIGSRLGSHMPTPVHTTCTQPQSSSSPPGSSGRWSRQPTPAWPAAPGLAWRWRTPCWTRAAWPGAGRTAGRPRQPPRASAPSAGRCRPVAARCPAPPRHRAGGVPGHDPGTGPAGGPGAPPASRSPGPGRSPCRAFLRRP